MTDALSVIDGAVAEEEDFPLGGNGTAEGEPPLRRAVPSSPSQVLGDALWLMSQSAAHKHLFLADIDWLVMPPILTRQFRLFKVGDRPYAFVSWASLSAEVATRITGGSPRLSPGEWKSGDQAWLIDVVAPFGGAEGVLKELKAKVFADRPLMTLRREGEAVVSEEVGV